MQNDKNGERQEGVTRREFVEKTSALAGGIALAGALSACGAGTGEEQVAAPASTAAVAGEGTLKLALVGCGERGTGATSNALKADGDVVLVAVADVFADQAESCVGRLRAKFGDKRVQVTPGTTFTGLEAYRQAIDLADVVILTTPGGFRPEHFEYAVSRNRHVFMEKPVATDAPGIRRVLAAARQADEHRLNVVVGLQRRHQISYNALYQHYRQSDIGEIISGQVYWNGDAHESRMKLRQPGQTELEYQLRNWYYFNWLSGDQPLEQNLHNIDVANWFIGEYPVSAAGSGGRQVRTGPQYGQVFDHHFVELVYPSGAIVHAQCRQINGCPRKVKEQFQTVGGKIECTDDFVNKGYIERRDGTRIYSHRGLTDGSAYQDEHDNLFAAIRSGEHINNAEYAAKSTLTAIMVRMASYSGQTIGWEEAMASELRLVPDSAELSWDGEAPVMPDAEGRYPVPMPGITLVL